ncbi:hypothetical protein ACP3P6_09165 [Enterobacter mori]
MACASAWGRAAATAPDAKQITQELEQAKAKPAQPETVESLQSALNALEERKGSLERAQQYQQVIDNFPKLSQTLRSQLNNLRDEPREVPVGLTSDALNQEILRLAVSYWKRADRRSRNKSAHVKSPTRSASYRSSRPMPAVS